MLIIDKHCSYVCCDEFPVAQIDAKVNKQKNSDTKILIITSVKNNSLF